MTSSDALHAPRVGPEESGPGPAPRGRSTVRDAVVNAVTAASFRVIPRLPDVVKRVVLGGRSVTVDGNTLDTTLQLMLTGERVAGIGGLVASEDVAVARTQLRTVAAMFPCGIAADVSDIEIPGPAGPIPARHYRPVQAVSGPAPLLVFFHGGGFVIGDLETHDDLCRRISRDGGMHVLSVDYRLAPEHKAPAAVDDADAAYRWAADHAAELGADPQRVAVGGDSAGGNLAAVVCQHARRDGVRPPALQLLIYPVTDLSSDTRSKTLFADGYFLTARDMNWFAANYVDGSSVAVDDPVVSPLLADDLRGLPPALVLTGGFDPLRDEGNRYAEALRTAGNAVELREESTLVHGFVNFFPLGGGSERATADMISALRAHLQHP
ncbi:alpha/beta hydrolase [Mycobacterium sp. CPCC 205372]|uniref:Alpha/beta hydrolase n=1 Tax=Mycobacterium hippophais TaxID=3016340 RepID=A0ABT4PV17_9MYCO|nr:alpha/beta hydrolase [Mycobacterium hippophais]MCZ8380385.1 alpha/beta hydrolase [Mycobacterium hippophais]